MFKSFLFLAAMTMPGFSQDLRVISSIQGAITADESLTGNHLTVKLTEAITRAQIDRVFVAGDGRFEFHNVPVGSYTVELAVAGGETILKETVSLHSSGDQIDLRLPARGNKPSPAGTVSVRELQHPLTRKSKRMFAEALKASGRGEYGKAIEVLRNTMSDPAAEPYARMNIGVAYLRAGQAAEAVPELREAVRLMPKDAVGRTNLAFALLLTKSVDAAEEQAGRALELDKNNAKARWVMGSVLLTKGVRIEEGVEDLRLASREIPKSRVILAQFYERNGLTDAAARELRAFLPNASSEDRATVEKWLMKLAAK